MRKLIIFFILLCSIAGYSQTTPIASKQFATITDLRAQAGTANVIVTLSGLTAMNDKNGGTYQWDAANVSADDGVLVIKVANVTTGRWIKKLNDNVIKGSVIFNGTALQTAYPVTFQSALPFTPSAIFIQPTSINAAALSWVSNKSTTGFTVNFLSVPVLGTNNITFDYIVIKQ